MSSALHPHPFSAAPSQRRAHLSPWSQPRAPSYPPTPHAHSQLQVTLSSWLAVELRGWSSPRPLWPPGSWLLSLGFLCCCPCPPELPVFWPHLHRSPTSTWHPAAAQGPVLADPPWAASAPTVGPKLPATPHSCQHHTSRPGHSQFSMTLGSPESLLRHNQPRPHLTPNRSRNMTCPLKVLLTATSICCTHCDHSRPCAFSFWRAGGGRDQPQHTAPASTTPVPTDPRVQQGPKERLGLRRIRSLSP